MELLFISSEDGRSRYYFESDMQEFDRKAASDTYSRTDGNLRHSFKSAQQVKNLLGALSLCLRQKSAVFSSKTNGSAKYSSEEVIPMYSAVLSEDIPYGSLP